MSRCPTKDIKGSSLELIRLYSEHHAKTEYIQIGQICFLLQYIVAGAKPDHLNIAPIIVNSGRLSRYFPVLAWTTIVHVSLAFTSLICDSKWIES